MTKQEHITKAPAIEYVPMADLYLSDLNPRQEVVEEGIALLAESIATCGLIQNLSGSRDQDGKVGIVAGGRRLRALQLAVKLDPSLDPVPVRLAPDAKTAQVWANVENAARVDLNPADEIRAFAKQNHPIPKNCSLTWPMCPAGPGKTPCWTSRTSCLTFWPSRWRSAWGTGRLLGCARTMW